MDEAVADGFTVLRAWATAVDPQYSLQPSPGNFSEPIFRGLDYVLDQARQRNLKVRMWLPLVLLLRFSIVRACEGPCR